MCRCGFVLMAACGIVMAEGFAPGSSPELSTAWLPQARAQSGLLALRCSLPFSQASPDATTTAAASRRQVGIKGGKEHKKRCGRQGGRACDRIFKKLQQLGNNRAAFFRLAMLNGAASHFAWGRAVRRFNSEMLRLFEDSMGTGAVQAGRGRGGESRRRRACRGAASPTASKGLERTNRVQAGGRLCDGR